MEDVLFLAHRIPYPPNKGDKVRSYHLLLALSARYRVHLGCFIDDPRDWTHIVKVKDLCSETYFAPLTTTTVARRAICAALRNQAITPAIYRHRGLAEWTQSILRDRSPKCAYVFSSAMAQFVDPAPGVQRVMDFVDVDSEKWRQRAAKAHWPLSTLYHREAEKLLRHDRSVARQFDLSIFVSEHEAERFRSLVPEAADKVVYLRNGVDTTFFRPADDYPRPDIAGHPFVAFTGAMDYWPNEDAVVWFATEVLPLIHATNSRLRFVIAGRDPGARVRRLAERPGIDVVANPPDMRPYLAHAAAVVVPLRDSPGVANKVLEGMAMARPVVATPQAVAGISAEIGVDLLVEETPARLAHAVCLVLQNPGLADRLGAAARARVLADYQWEASLASLPAVIRGETAGRLGTTQQA